MKQKKFAKKYAKAVLLTMKIREESYDKKAAKKEKKKMQKKYPDAIGMVDYATFYRKDMMESAQEALNDVGLSQQLAYPLYLSMDWWNDMHDWAQEILHGKKHESRKNKNL